MNEEKIEELTLEEIQNWDNSKPENDVRVFHGDLHYIIWGGTKKHPKPNFHVLKDVDIEEKGCFYTVKNDKGKKILRKKKDSNGTLAVDYEEEKRKEKIEDAGNKFILSYSTKWLCDTLDYPSILNNFIYIFELVDVPQIRSLHVSKKSRAGVFEKAFQDESSKIYPCFTVFTYHNSLASMQMNAYYNFLKKNWVFLEKVIEDFFTKYLQKEFDCSEMRIKMPSERTEYLEKCNIIVSSFETILRQFKLYVEKGSVDFELIGMSTTPINFSDIPSLVNEKYVYGIGDDFKNIVNLMFSDQCLYTYIPCINNEGNKYNCLADLFQNEKIYLTDYKEQDKPTFEYLKKFDLVKISDDGLITLKIRTDFLYLRIYLKMKLSANGIIHLIFKKILVNMEWFLERDK